jgi:AraC-like DNA-binding protein
MKRQQLILGLTMTVLTVLAQTDTIPMTKIVPQRLPDLNIPRFCHGTFFSDGELTVTGGHTSSFVPTPTAEFLKDGKWQVMQMAYTHDDGLCVPLRNGKVLLAGGYEKNLGVGQTIEAELYDPATHTFEGFGCLDRRRAQVSGIELPGGQVVAAGNWYHPDAIETYDGGMYFETARDVSLPRSRPYLFRTSDGDVMVISGCWDNYGKPITSNIVDRLKGEPFRVPLLETWKPYLLGHTPRSDDSFIGDEDKGDCAYLLPVQDSTGQVAIAEVRDTVFSLLPTTVPIPMKSRFGEISYYTSVVVDRQSQRGYIIGCDTLCRKYILCIEYARQPAPLTLYYTDPLTDADGCTPVLTPEGHLVTTGGIIHGGTWFTPSAAVWLFPVSNPVATSEAKGSPIWPWILLAGLIVLAFLAYLIIYKRRNPASESDGESEGQVHDSSEKNQATCPPDSPRDEQLMQRIIQLMEEQRPYLDSDLKQADVATALGVRLDEVSRCINSYAFNFSQFVNGYRIEYAKQLMLRKPGIKMTQVAIESGFSSDRTFYRAFNTIVGMPPSDWISQKTTDKL